MGYVNVPGAIGWIAGSVMAGHLYESGGDKANLARRYLVEELGVDQATADAIPRSDVVASLGEKLSVDALEVQRILFDHYDPASVWYLIGGIGLASILCMIIYDRAIRHYDAKAS